MIYIYNTKEYLIKNEKYKNQMEVLLRILV